MCSGGLTSQSPPFDSSIYSDLMRLRYYTLLTLFIVSIAWIAPSALAQTDVTLVPSQDNTLYEDAEGALSNGAGQHLFVGRTGQNNNGTVRRALVRFDVAAVVPSGALIDSVSLTLNVSRVPPGAETHTATLHRVTADWGEGDADAGGQEGSGTSATSGDATWVHTFFDGSQWETPGGDFEATAIASAEIGGPGSYTWGSTAAMTANVQSWLDAPDQNFGWIIVGTEGANQTARRFDSREHPTEANRPMLRVYYSQTTAAEETETPALFRLAGAYPNPFRDATTIAYELDAPAHVTLKVFDMLGRQVAHLVDSPQRQGTHRVDFDAVHLPDGLYVYRLQADAAVAYGRMVQVR